METEHIVRLYALASLINKGGTNTTIVSYFAARSPQEAIGIAYEDCIKRFPLEEGYSSPSIVVIEIPSSFWRGIDETNGN